MTIILRRRWRRQPQYQAQLDRSNPLARDLFAASVSGGPNLVTGGLPVVSSVTPGATLQGRSVQRVSSASYAYVPYSATLSTVGCTLLAVAVSDPSFNRHLLGMLGDESSGSNFSQVALAGGSDSLGGDAPGSLAFWGFEIDFKWRLASAGQINDTRPHTFVGVADLPGLAVSLWMDGNKLDTSTSITSLPTYTPKALCVLGSPNESRATTGAVLTLAWNRALSDAEVRAVSADPWQLLLSRRGFSAAPGASSIPSITAVYADNITATSVVPRVTLDFA